MTHQQRSRSSNRGVALMFHRETTIATRAMYQIPDALRRQPEWEHRATGCLPQFTTVCHCSAQGMTEFHARYARQKKSSGWRTVLWAHIPAYILGTVIPKLQHFLVVTHLVSLSHTSVALFLSLCMEMFNYDCRFAWFLLSAHLTVEALHPYLQIQKIG
ncbi:hypothetical protein BDZ91DRAFT_779726 [Kalaharituber pfeilii]|nr:hypothetical protein BDZ91DRAFT_779726 [Kalaharituber pfeilii]